MLGKISGFVINSEGQPLNGVTVEFGGRKRGHTNFDGSFEFTAPKGQKTLAVTFVVPDYLPNTRIFQRANAVNNIVVVWSSGSAIVRFAAASGGEFDFGRARIAIPPKAIVDARGRKVDEVVRLRFTLLDISDRLQRAAAPELNGRLLDGSIKPLSSFGIFQIRTERLSGEALELARGAEINLSIGVPERLRRLASPKTGIFSFDRVHGLWIQEGVFALDPAPLFYNGTVTRFDWGWNLDDPLDITCITVKVVNAWNSQPMQNMQVTAHGLNYDSSGTTDANGLVCLLVQKGGSINLTAWGMVGSSYYLNYPGGVNATAPSFASGASDCGNLKKCPLIATVPVDLIVGMTVLRELKTPRFLG